MRTCDHSEVEEVNKYQILRVLGAAETTMQMGNVIAGAVLSVYSAARNGYQQLLATIACLSNLQYFLQATDKSAEVYPI